MRGRGGLRLARLDELGTPEAPAPAARFDTTAPDRVGADSDTVTAAPIAEFGGSEAAAGAPVAVFGDDTVFDDDGARMAGSPGPVVAGASGSAPVADFAASGGPPADQGSAAPIARLDGGGRRNGESRRPLLIVQPESAPKEPEHRPDDQQRRRSGRPRPERPTPSGRTGDHATPPPARRPFGPKQIDPDADPAAAAGEICLRLLTDRARTRQELAQALQRRGVPDEVAGSVLERFDEVGLIDDAAFAAQFVRSRHNHKGLARRAIAMELRRKGVDGEVAEEALGEVDADSESRRARELVDRKLRSLTVTTPEQRTVAARRLVGMLARKGYGAGTAYGVVREALAAHGADPDELAEDATDD